MSRPVEGELPQAARAAQRGRFDELERCVATLDPSTPAADAWKAYLKRIRWLAGLSDDCPPLPRRSPQHPSSADAESVNLGAAARIAVVTLDGHAIAHVAQCAHEIGPHVRDPTAALTCLGARAWARIFSGHVDGLDEELAAHEREAKKLGDAEQVVEFAAMRSFAAAAAGALPEALDAARRASRMARTEALPQAEYLANLALARLRRLDGRPYLASRILTALGRFAPRPWHSWIGWELAMAAGRSVSSSALVTAPPAATLLEVIRGDRNAPVDALCERSSGCAWLATDVRRALGALGLPVDAMDPVVEAWTRGVAERHDPPWGLSGIARAPDAAVGSVAFVLAGPDTEARRLLGPVTSGSDELGSERAGRAESILAVLALAGEAGIEKAAMFEAAYGFPFRDSLHRGALDVALHRARARVDGLGEIITNKGRLRLRCDRPVKIPDPRCYPVAEDRVLAQVALCDAASAKDIAAASNIPLRTVQQSLRALVDGGACAVRRDGRQVLYAVEDTTFQEPTIA